MWDNFTMSKEDIMEVLDNIEEIAKQEEIPKHDKEYLQDAAYVLRRDLVNRIPADMAGVDNYGEKVVFARKFERELLQEAFEALMVSIYKKEGFETMEYPDARDVIDQLIASRGIAWFNAETDKGEKMVAIWITVLGLDGKVLKEDYEKEDFRAITEKWKRGGRQQTTIEGGK